MRPTLLLFVGARSGRVADVTRSLDRVADVVVVTSTGIVGRRADSIDDGVVARDVLVAASDEAMVDEALGYAARNRVDGVVSFSDDVVEVTARFAAAAGLRGLAPEDVPRFRDKFEQRLALAAGGLRVPAFFELRGPDDVPAALAAVPTPAVLKPTKGSGGALATPISSPDELEPALRAALAAVGGTGGAVENDTAFVLESMLVGRPQHPVEGFAPYVSVESVAVDGELRHLAVTDRFPQAPPFLETGMMLPSCLTPDQLMTVTQTADAALRALSFRQGLAHTELMLTADGPVVIEVNARAGGALPYLFPLASDVDLVEIAGQAALGRLPDLPRFSRRAVFVAPQHPVGVEVLAVHGLDEVRELPDVRVVIPLALAGTRTDAFRGTMAAVVLGAVDTPQHAVGLWREVMATVRGDYRRVPAQPDDADQVAVAG